MAAHQQASEAGQQDAWHDTFWINTQQCEFYPEGSPRLTKLGLLWRGCSIDRFRRRHGLVPRGLERSCNYFECLEHSGVVVACLPSDMSKLTALDVDLLRPVYHDHRPTLLGARLRNGVTCRVGDCVLARKLTDHGEPRKFTVKYKGYLRERDRDLSLNGIYFGLVSTEPVKHPTARDVSCFDNIYSPDVAQYAVRGSDEYDCQAVLCTVQWIVALADKKPFPLKVDHQVLLFVDDRPEPMKGVVKRLLDGKHTALVELDRDGKKTLDEVPVDALMLASDYEGKGSMSALTPSQSGGTDAAAAAAADSPSASGHRRKTDNYDNANAGNSTSDAPQQQQQPPTDPAVLAAEHGLELNAAVLVSDGHGPPLQGFLRWCGRLRSRSICGVDCEQAPLNAVDAITVRRACLDAPTEPGIAFVRLDQVRLDPRFREAAPEPDLTASQRFGHDSCEIVHGDCPPVPEEDWHELVGPSRGLQGHHNSCYLDATLFAMFATVSVFDGVLLRKRRKTDIANYDNIQSCLKLNIVNCLRKHYFVRADHVLELRGLLDNLNRVPGMLSEEKDPEEFINLLLDHALKHQPYIKLSSNQDCHVLQLFVDASQHKLDLPDTETLLHLTLLQADLKLNGTPPCLVLQTPRSGKDYKLFDRVMPSTELDISNLLTDHPHQCAVCGKLADVECPSCFMEFAQGKDYAFCKECFDTFIKHKKSKLHKPRTIKYPMGLSEHYSKQKTFSCPVKLKLFAVVCIHTSHYVCFLRLCQPNGQPAKWLFFDSMADRNGMQSGFNIPEVTDAGDIDAWLKPDRLLSEPKEKQPDHVRRLLSDCYLCFYQSEDAQMYR